jgi:hypothetical protein
MKTANPLRHVVYAFLIALVIYVIFYFGIENRRTHNGPWKVSFVNETNTPTLIINQPTLNITDLRIIFPNDTPTNTFTNVPSLTFDQPREWPFDVPFGQCVFEDTTFLPGTLAFKILGHEVQLMPRVLTIDRREYAWQSHATIALNKADTSRVAP